MVGIRRKTLTEARVTKYVKKYLSETGYRENKNDLAKNKHSRGPDIVMTKKGARHKYIIECKAGSYEEIFLVGLGQLCTRMNRIPKGVKYGLALPKNFAERAIRRIPKKFARHNNVFILSVHNNGKVVEYSSKDMQGV